jgi:hypothetical protein
MTCWTLGSLKIHLYTNFMEGLYCNSYTIYRASDVQLSFFLQEQMFNSLGALKKVSMGLHRCCLGHAPETPIKISDIVMPLKIFKAKL